MSAEIPGSKPEYREATLGVTELVSKIMIATGNEVKAAQLYGYRAGSYAGEIVLAALTRAGLLSADFSLERFSEAVQSMDQEMALDKWVSDVAAQESGQRL